MSPKVSMRGGLLFPAITFPLKTPAPHPTRIRINRQPIRTNRPLRLETGITSSRTFLIKNPLTIRTPIVSSLSPQQRAEIFRRHQLISSNLTPTPSLEGMGTRKEGGHRQGSAPAPMAGFRSSVVAARMYWLPNIFLPGAKRRIFVFIFVWTSRKRESRGQPLHPCQDFAAPLSRRGCTGCQHFPNRREAPHPS